MSKEELPDGYTYMDSSNGVLWRLEDGRWNMYEKTMNHERISNKDADVVEKVFRLALREDVPSQTVRGIVDTLNQIVMLKELRLSSCGTQSGKV